MYGLPSRFLREIPGPLVNDVRPAPVRGVASGSPTRHLSQGHVALEAAPDIDLGASVRHPGFGTGTVIGVEGSGAHARVQVNFDDAGSKWLVLAYAKLERV